jgi:hypothetical protein
LFEHRISQDDSTPAHSRRIKRWGTTGSKQFDGALDGDLRHTKSSCDGRLLCAASDMQLCDGH